MHEDIYRPQSVTWRFARGMSHLKQEGQLRDILPTVGAILAILYFTLIKFEQLIGTETCLIRIADQN